jgi:hypothetical protein
MLQFETLPASWSALLSTFRCCFTRPGFQTFVVLMSGLVAAPARRTVTGMLIGAGVSGVWHHSRAYRFLDAARWCVEQVGLVLLKVIVDRLLPAGEPVLVGIDDTLFRRSGPKVHAAGWQHDGSAKGPRANRVGWGNCWVIAGVIVQLPFLDRPVCLPVAFALWRPEDPKSGRGRRGKATSGKATSGADGATAVQGPSKQTLMCRMVTSIAQACPGRRIHVVADAWYAGADGAPGAGHPKGGPRDRGLPEGVTLTSRLRVNAALQAIAVPVPGKAGRPKRVGDKIGTPKNLADRADTTWTPTTVHRYGRTTTVTIADTTCLWYGVYRSRAVRVILLRDTNTTGYDLALITTDLTTPAAAIVQRYAARWSIEVAIEDAKQITGVGEARNRNPTAVRRTVPFALITQSLVVVWYTLHGHHPDDVTQRRANAPWYTTKTQPAYQDMITKLRRHVIAAKFRGRSPHQPTHQEIHAIQQAWAEAAA